MSSTQYKTNQRRLSDRIKLAAQVVLAGQTHEVLDWSFSGFSIAKSDSDFKSDAVFDAVFLLPFDHYTAQCNVQAEVRVVHADTIGFEFCDIPHGVRLLMREYVEESVDGRLHGPTQETPTQPSLLPPSPAPTASPDSLLSSDDRPDRTFKRKFIQYLVMSLLLALAIVGILISQRYVMSTQAGLVGNSAEIRSRVDGYVKTILIKTGDKVAAGQLVIALDDREAHRNLRAGAFVQQRLEASVKAAEKALRGELVNDKLYSRIAGWRNLAEQARVAENNALLAQASVELKRSEELYKSGFVSSANLEDRRNAFARSSAGLNRVKAEASLAHDVDKGAQDGRFFSNSQITNRTMEMTQLLQRTNAELAQAIAQLGPLFSALEYTSINAPTAGTVRLVNRAPGEVLRAGDLVALIETNAEPTVLAKFLVADVFRISPGQNCRVIFPALDVIVPCVVNAVVPPALVTEANGMANTAETGMGEASVSVRLVDPPPLPGGLRARVEIDTRQSVFTLLRQRLQ